MANFFTSDWHIGDSRLNILGRDFEHKDATEFGIRMIYTLRDDSGFRNGDTLYFLGDFMVKEDPLVLMFFMKNFNLLWPDSKRVLIEGNYDEGKHETLKGYFHEIRKSMDIELFGKRVLLHHYPKSAHNAIKAGKADFALVGHIHGAWRVQPYMVNVGVDAWNYRIVTEEMLKNQMFCMEEIYDENVFPTANLETRPDGKQRLRKK